MKQIVVDSFAEWRLHARASLRSGLHPGDIHFLDAHLRQPRLEMHAEHLPVRGADASGSVPREFLRLAESAALFRDVDKWNVLYRVLWRLVNGEPHLLEIDVDDDVRRLCLMDKAVHRDIHKMHAFVRFREVATEQGPEYVAWHRPDHLIVGASASFFVRRFGSMRWAILTPDKSAYWDLTQLRFGPGLPREAAPADEQMEDLWRTYYSSIFNPARANLRAMRAEMPVRHWATLPESRIVNELLRDAGDRTFTMVNDQPASAAPWIPGEHTIPALRLAASACQGCDLHLRATQPVFGEGPTNARVVMVGEQPGDQEDLSGRPFVGPAGQLLNRALQAAGVDRQAIYLTNAVKHFRFEERGKRRIHQKPSGLHVSACRPWIEAEL
ncbi:MAG TPA: UdgX family uracil-DNA binding protein, partial [Bryobacteraceae bacterium]|nr:UdgX family uracil-DNA binding protein [Bryobacteraceae bacterium]